MEDNTNKSRDLVPTGESKDFAQIEIERITNLDKNKVGSLYDILGVEEDATQEEISKAFRTLAKHIHPDVCSHEGAKDVYYLIDKAYKTLSDEESRRLYDQYNIIDEESIESIISSMCGEFSQAINAIDDRIIHIKSPFDILYGGYEEHIKEKRKEYKNKNKSLRKINKVKKALIKKGSKEVKGARYIKRDFLKESLDEEIYRLRKDMENIEKDIKVTQFKIEVLDNYDYWTENYGDINDIDDQDDKPNNRHNRSDLWGIGRM